MESPCKTAKKRAGKRTRILGNASGVTPKCKQALHSKERKDAWTKTEKELLLSYVNKVGGTQNVDWEDCSKRLNHQTGCERSPKACQRAYTRYAALFEVSVNNHVHSETGSTSQILNKSMDYHQSFATDYCRVICDTMHRFSTNERFCDTLIHTCTSPVYAHAVVLASVSRDLDLLISPCTEENTHGMKYELNIQRVGCNAQAMQALLQYCYTGLVGSAISEHSVDMMHVTAQYLGIKPVVSMCVKYKRDVKQSLERTASKPQSDKIPPAIERRMHVVYPVSSSSGAVPLEPTKLRSNDYFIHTIVKIEPNGDNGNAPVTSPEQDTSQCDDHTVQSYNMHPKVESTRHIGDTSHASEAEHDSSDGTADDVDTVSGSIRKRSGGRTADQSGSKKQKQGNRPIESFLNQNDPDDSDSDSDESTDRLSTSVIATPDTDQSKPFTSSAHSSSVDTEQPEAMTSQEYVCELCLKTFTDVTGFRVHELTAHADVFYCKICASTFSNKSSLTRHMKRHNGDVIKCPECPKTFTCSNDLKRHYAPVHEGKVFNCEHCNKTFKYKTDLLGHLPSHTGEYKYTCDVCKKGFGRKWHLDLHSRIHLTSNPYACDKCRKTFARKSVLEFHSTVCGREGQNVECAICYKRFKVQKYLNDHMVAMHTGSGFPCEHCGRIYSMKKYLKAHEKKKHMNLQ